MSDNTPRMGDDLRIMAEFAIFESDRELMNNAADIVEVFHAALQQISDMGPMSVDDQRWRIAREALTSGVPKAQLTPQQQMAANVEPDPFYNRVGSPIQP